MRRLMRRRFEKSARVEPHQAAIAFLTRRQQDDSGRLAAAPSANRLLVAEIDRQRTADDRLDAVAGDLVGEFQRAEHVVDVGQRQRRLVILLGELRELPIVIAPCSSE